MTRVKICGISTPQTMQAALDCGADFVGLMFFQKSPRNISLAQAAKLADQARGSSKIVTVVVDAEDQLLQKIALEVSPDFIQAHGRESPDRIVEIKALTGIPVYKVLSVSTAKHVAKAKDYSSSPFIMYDAKSPAGATRPGGHGLSFDWTILKDVNHPFMLAGGLNRQNVAEAIRVSGANMVDVSSGVESAPGVKDIALIRNFIEAARAAR